MVLQPSLFFSLLLTSNPPSYGSVLFGFLGLRRDLYSFLRAVCALTLLLLTLRFPKFCFGNFDTLGFFNFFIHPDEIFSSVKFVGILRPEEIPCYLVDSDKVTQE